MCVCVCVYIYIYVCRGGIDHMLDVYIYIYMYIYMYIYIYRGGKDLLGFGLEEQRLFAELGAPVCYPRPAPTPHAPTTFSPNTLLGEGLIH